MKACLRVLLLRTLLTEKYITPCFAIPLLCDTTRKLSSLMDVATRDSEPVTTVADEVVGLSEEETTPQGKGTIGAEVITSRDISRVSNVVTRE